MRDSKCVLCVVECKEARKVGSIDTFHHSLCDLGECLNFFTVLSLDFYFFIFIHNRRIVVQPCKVIMSVKKMDVKYIILYVIDTQDLISYY